MKKRLISLGLTLALVLGLLPYAVLGAAVTSDVDPGYNTASGTASESALFSTAYVRNKGAGSGGNGTAKNIEVVVNLKSGGEATQLVYAVVMLAKNFDDTYAANVANINNTTYATLSATAVSPNYYAMSARAKGTGGTVTLPLVPASAANASTMQGGGTVANKVMQGSPVTGKYYHEEYVLVVFAHDADGHAERYYIDRFYLDSEGYVLTPSYAVRYNANNPPHTSGYTNNVTNLPGFQIQRAAWTDDRANAAAQAPGDMKLTSQQPKRTGYEFVGWTTAALDPLAEGTAAPANGSTVTSGTKSATFYTASGTFPQPAKLYTATDLYALWRVVPVKFSHNAQAGKYTVAQEDGKGWVMTWIEPIPQVGVGFNTGNIPFAQGPGGKIYKVVTYENGTQIHDSGNPNVNPPVSKYTLAVKKGTADTNWTISGTPKDHSNGKTAELVITVTDVSNNTSDTITVRFSQVKKGAQPIPTADANTGLQSKVQTTDQTGAPLETPDGQIFGFYSTGPVTSSDYEGTGYLPTTTTAANGTYGTGTMTAYYLNLGMVFEYMPVKLKDADGILQDVADNKGWREVPFPESWYSEADQADLTASMQSGATRKIVSSKAGNNAKATITASDCEAWPASYGYITFDEGLPVIHGLHEDDVYWVRFRSNEQYEVSKEREIAIGGAVSGGGETPAASGGLAVNLAGGSESENSSGYSELKTAAKNLIAGQELDLNVYDFEPTRDGSAFLGWTLGERDTDGNLILYRADEPETITVTWVDHDGTVIVEAITVKVGDPLPGHPAENPTREGYTFDQWVRSEDGEGNVTFTATYTEVTEPEPEPTPTPTPDPESPAARDGEGDGEVTDPGEGGGEGEEPPPVTPTPPVGTAAIWVDGLTGETILEGTTETEAPKKPFHSCYTAAEEWTEVTGEDGTVTYTISYTRNTKVPMPETTPASLAAVWQGGSDPDPSDFASIVFYDWDEATVLGSIVVAKGVDATDEVNKFVQTQMSPNSRDYTGNEGDPYFVDDAAFPMTYKKGYSFEGCWLPYESDVPTVYGTRVDAANAGTVTKPERPKDSEIDFRNVTENLIVKAAYNENSELNTTNATNRRYTAEAISYTRFATTQNYGITVQIKRENANGEGVPRIVNPALRITLATTAGNIMMMIPLDSTDVTTAQVVANGAVSRVTWAVIETYNNNNWVGAGGRTANINSNAGTMNVRDSGFLYLCTLGGINDMLEEYTTMANPTTTVYNYINNNSLTGIGLTVPSGVTIVRAKDALLAAWADKNCERDAEGNPIIDSETGRTVIKPKSERVGLTFEEMNTALATANQTT